MGNAQTKGLIHTNRGHKKYVHWDQAVPPWPPGKPHLVPGSPNNQADAVTIRWDPPPDDGGAPITGYVVEHRKSGTPHWVRSTKDLVLEPELRLSGLEPGWRYQFRVTAENAADLLSDPGELSQPLTVARAYKPATMAPQFSLELKDLVVLENEKAEFVVHFHGIPTPKICWYKDSFEVFSSRRLRVVTENGFSSLVIFQCAFSDEGEYKCSATNRAGHIFTKAKLRLEAPPCIRIPRQYEDGLLFEKDEVIRLKVSVFGRPLPRVTWYHESEPIPFGGRFEVTNTDRFSALRISEARRADRGEYQVHATSRLGEDIVAFLVTVTDRPMPPGRAKVVTIMGRSVTLSWTEPNDDGGCKIGNYLVEYYRLGWNVWLKAATCRQLTTTLGDLIGGSEYKFRVKAENPYGVSDPSEESEVVFIPDPKRGLLERPVRGTRSQSDIPMPEQIAEKKRGRSKDSLMATEMIEVKKRKDVETKRVDKDVVNIKKIKSEEIWRNEGRSSVSSLDRSESLRRRTREIENEGRRSGTSLDRSESWRRRNKEAENEGRRSASSLDRSESLKRRGKEVEKRSVEFIPDDVPEIVKRRRRPSLERYETDSVPKTAPRQPKITPPAKPSEPEKGMKASLQFSMAKRRENSGDRDSGVSEGSFTTGSKQSFITDSKQSFSTESNKSFVMDSKPSFSEENKKSFTFENKSRFIEENKKSFTMENKSRFIEDSKPKFFEESKPRFTEESKPRFIEESKPRFIEESKPRIVEDSKPRIIVESKPRIIEESKPRVIEDNKQTFNSLLHPREDDNLLHGSSELMLVLLPESRDQHSEKEAQNTSQYAIFGDSSVPPPMSLSAPELGGGEPLVTSPLRNAVSSTELLHEQAMARFYQAVADEEAEKARKRKDSLERKSAEPSVSISTEARARAKLLESDGAEMKDLSKKEQNKALEPQAQELTWHQRKQRIFQDRRGSFEGVTTLRKTSPQPEIFFQSSFVKKEEEQQFISEKYEIPIKSNLKRKEPVKQLSEEEEEEMDFRSAKPESNITSSLHRREPVKQSSEEDEYDELMSTENDNMESILGRKQLVKLPSEEEEMEEELEEELEEEEEEEEEEIMFERPDINMKSILGRKEHSALSSKEEEEDIFAKIRQKRAEQSQAPTKPERKPKSILRNKVEEMPLSPISQTENKFTEVKGVEIKVELEEGDMTEDDYPEHEELEGEESMAEDNSEFDDEEDLYKRIEEEESYHPNTAATRRFERFAEEEEEETYHPRNMTPTSTPAQAPIIRTLERQLTPRPTNEVPFFPKSILKNSNTSFQQQLEEMIERPRGIVNRELERSPPKSFRENIPKPLLPQLSSDTGSRSPSPIPISPSPPTESPLPMSPSPPPMSPTPEPEMFYPPLPKSPSPLPTSYNRHSESPEPEFFMAEDGEEADNFMDSKQNTGFTTAAETSLSKKEPGVIISDIPSKEIGPVAPAIPPRHVKPVTPEIPPRQNRAVISEVPPKQAASVAPDVPTKETEIPEATPTPLSIPEKTTPSGAPPTSIPTSPPPPDPPISPEELARQRRMLIRKASIEEAAEEKRAMADHYGEIIRDYTRPKRPAKRFTTVSEMKAAAAAAAARERERKLNTPEPPRSPTPEPEPEPEPEFNELSPEVQKTIVEQSFYDRYTAPAVRAPTPSRSRGSRTPDLVLLRQPSRQSSRDRTRMPSTERFAAELSKRFPEVSRRFSPERSAEAPEKREKPKEIVRPVTPKLPPLKDEPKEVTESKMRFIFGYLADLAMFLVACWLYAFKDERYAIPIIIILVYRQIYQALKRKMPKLPSLPWRSDSSDS